MSRRRVIYEAHKDGMTVLTGTVEEMADFFHVATSTIGNCERTGRKLHKEYAIERIGG